MPMPAEMVVKTVFYVRCLDCRFRSRDFETEDEAVACVQMHGESLQGRPRCRPLVSVPKETAGGEA